MTATSDSTRLRLPLTVRGAAFLFLFLGVAFGASVPFVLAYLGRNGELPMTFGFRHADEDEGHGPRSGGSAKPGLTRPRTRVRTGSLWRRPRLLWRARQESRVPAPTTIAD